VILPDSSAWIEYLRGTGSPAHRRLATAVRAPEDLAVTGPVRLEVLAGARDEGEAEELARLLGSARPLQVEDPSDYEAAAAIYRSCRRAGQTIGSISDCLIAAVAVRTGAELLHCDSDFELIAERVPLRLVALG